MAQVDFGVLTSKDAAHVALQRTANLVVLPIIGSPSYRAWVRGFPIVLKVESTIRKNAIFAGAMDDAGREFEALQRFLGDRAIRRIADIGCGHAFVDLLFHRHYACSITLIDIETSETHRHEFNSSGSGYASLSQAKAFLTTNGVSAQDVHLVNPQRTQLPPGPFDLIFSLLSAGFHYPIDEYAAYARNHLRPGGTLIFDKRHKTSPNLDGFREIAVVEEGHKHQRLALTL